MADSSAVPPRRLWPFALTIFWGAFLLFLIQPLIGKYILPWFGGTPGVWTTCLLFFQCLLLGGYAYAHVLNHFLPLRKQVIVHGILLVLAVLTLPITPSEALKPDGTGSPTWDILVLLAFSIGLPYLVLSATGPLVQAWFAKARPRESPYRLYALSNVGSLLALLGFPFLMEPWTTRTFQVNGWSWGMAIYALACGYLAWSLRDVASETDEEEEIELEVQSRFRIGITWMMWLALPACGTALLMATTNKMCQDVAVVPFLWVLPLALYLGTFIISFDSPRWYVREIYAPLMLASWVGVVWVMDVGVDIHVAIQVILFCAALFISCMVCHGELYRLRPEPARLTQYFLGISAGGALGGFFVAVVAPMVFIGYWEYHIALWLVGCLFVVVQLIQREKWVLGKWHVRGVLAACWGAVCLAMFRYTDFGLAARLWLTFGSMLGGWLLARYVLTHWWAGRAATEMMEIKSAGAGTVLTLIGVLWCLIMAGALGDQPFRLLWLELSPGIWLAAALFALNVFVWISVRRWKGWAFHWAGALPVLVPALVVLGVYLTGLAREKVRGAEFTARNFYGTVKVTRYQPGTISENLSLLNGQITHGFQYTDPNWNNLKTTYFSEYSGAGIAVRLTRQEGHRMGVVGLGVGTMAAYANKGDLVRFYDINPLVEFMSSDEKELFTYCSNATARGAKVDIVMGDARLMMERELREKNVQQYDVLVLDAFSSDSIPVHLLTKESFELYDRHMKSDGIVAVHISNRYLDLEPVVERLARELDYRMIVVETIGGDEWDEAWVYPCSWVLLTRNDSVVEQLRAEAFPEADLSRANELPLWTDDYASIFRIMLKPDWWPEWLGGSR